jgi:hypothetical protein
LICPAALPASSVPGWTRHRPRWSADIRYSSVLGLAAAPPTGIVHDVQGALPTSTARLLNAWQGRAGGGFVSVYAGAAAGDANQGVVVVVTLEDARHPTLGQQLVKTPSRSGALRVTAAQRVAPHPAGRGGRELHLRHRRPALPVARLAISCTRLQRHTQDNLRAAARRGEGAARPRFRARA